MKQSEIITLLHEIKTDVAVIKTKSLSIETQTIKTNGRVDKHSERLDDVEKKQANFQGKLSVWITVGAFLGALLLYGIEHYFFK